MESSLYIEWHLTILLSTWVYFWHNMPEMHCIAWTYKIRDLANLVKIKIGIVIFGKSDALAAYIQFVLGIRYRYKSTFSERVSVYTGIYFVISSSQPSYLDLHKSQSPQFHSWTAQVNLNKISIEYYTCSIHSLNRWTLDTLTSDPAKPVHYLQQ